MSLERRVLTGSFEKINSEFDRLSLPYSELIFDGKNDNFAEMVTGIDLPAKIEEATSEVAKNMGKRLSSASKNIKGVFTSFPVVHTSRRAHQH